MPHLTIEYSGNLEAEIDIADLCETLRRALAETELFALAGIRVRAYRCDHWSIADGDSFHGFIDMSLRIRSGRPLENRKAATAHLFAAAKGFLAPSLKRRSLSLSLEMRNIDPELSPKTGSIRQHLKGA